MSALARPIAASAAQAQPRAERRPLDATVQCRRGMLRAAAEVVDLSRTGCRLRTLDPLRVGHEVWIRLPMLEALPARVVWTRGFESGCAFVRPLHPAVFEIVSRSR